MRKCGEEEEKMKKIMRKERRTKRQYGTIIKIKIRKKTTRNRKRRKQRKRVWKTGTWK